MPSPIQLDNLNLYAPMASSTQATYISDLKDFIMGLPWFNVLADDASITSDMYYDYLNMPLDALDMKEITWRFNGDGYNRSIGAQINGITLYYGSGTSYSTTNTFALKTTKTSAIIMNTSSTPNSFGVFGITKVHQIGSNIYTNAFYAATTAAMYLYTPILFGTNIYSLVTSFEYDVSTDYVIKPFVYDNYVFDEYYFIYSGPTITDDVIQISDDIYIRICGALFIKAN